MRVNLGSIEIDDFARQAIAHFYGRKGLATREDVRQFYVQGGNGTLDDACYDLSLYLDAKDAERGEGS